MFTTDTEYCKEAKTGNLILKEQNKKHLPPGFTVTFEKGINVVPLKKKKTKKKKQKQKKKTGNEYDQANAK